MSCDPYTDVSSGGHRVAGVKAGVCNLRTDIYIHTEG